MSYCTHGRCLCWKNCVSIIGAGNYSRCPTCNIQTSFLIWTLQVNARCLNVPRVLYGVGESAVSFSNFDIYLGYSPWWSNTQSVQVRDRDSGWSIVGKQLSSPKTFNTGSWAVINFVADTLDMDQIRDWVRALSSCCQQLGKFFTDATVTQVNSLTLIHLGRMGMIIQVWHR